MLQRTVKLSVASRLERRPVCRRSLCNTGTSPTVPASKLWCNSLSPWSSDSDEHLMLVYTQAIAHIVRGLPSSTCLVISSSSTRHRLPDIRDAIQEASVPAVRAFTGTLPCGALFICPPLPAGPI